MAKTDDHDKEPTRKERFPRRDYYRGDVDQPAQYHVLQCSNSHGHQAPLGMHDRRKGCGIYFINFTAKHWGTSAVRWQSNCPDCGRKQQRNRAHILATFDTRPEAGMLVTSLNNRAKAEKLATQIRKRFDVDSTIHWPHWEEYAQYLFNGVAMAPDEWLREASHIHEMLDCPPEEVEPELARYRALWEKHEDECGEEIEYLLESGYFQELVNDE